MLSFEPTDRSARTAQPSIAPDVLAMGEHLSRYIHTGAPLDEQQARDLIAGHAVGPQRLALHQLDGQFNVAALAALAPWLRVADVCSLDLPITGWALFARHPAQVAYPGVWTARHADPHHVVWRVLYANVVRQFMSQRASGALHVHMPQRVATKVSHRLPPPMWLLQYLLPMFDVYTLGGRPPTRCEITSPAALPCPRVELAITVRGGVAGVSLPGGITARLVGHVGAALLAGAQLDRMLVTVSAGAAGCVAFRMRRDPEARGVAWMATRVGDPATDFSPIEPRLLARLAQRYSTAPAPSELMDDELLVVLSDRCEQVVDCGAGRAFDRLLTSGQHVAVRVHLENLDRVPNPEALPVAHTLWAHRRDLARLVDAVREVRDFVMAPLVGVPRLELAREPLVTPLEQVLTLRLVFRFTLQTGRFQLEARDHRDPLHRTCLMLPRRVPGLVATAYLLESAQMGRADTPLLFDTGANQWAMDAPPCPSDATGPGQYGDRSPRADTLPPFTHEPSGSDGVRPAVSAGRYSLLTPPEQHPRLAECLEHRRAPVWLALSLSVVDPRLHDVMVPQCESALLVNDPHELLWAHGVRKARVYVHCDYRKSEAEAEYIACGPLTLEFNLQATESPYCVGGQFDRGTAPGWPTTQVDY